MVLLARCALIGIPASASPVAEVTLPLSSGVSSAARGCDGNRKAEAAANATIENAAPLNSLAFITLTFPVGFESRRRRVWRVLKTGFYASPGLLQRPKQAR